MQTYRMAKIVYAAACYSGLCEEDGGRSTCLVYVPYSGLFSWVEIFVKSEFWFRRGTRGLTLTGKSLATRD